jgi:hypothetical protein
MEFLNPKGSRKLHILLQLVQTQNPPKAGDKNSDIGKAAALQGAAAGGHLRRCRSSTMSPHRLRRGALHLPARRSRQNVNLLLREP